MKILELKQTSGERFTVIFEDGTQVKTSLCVVTDKFIYAGLELDDEEYRDFLDASSLSLAKSRALRIINTRPMSRKEMLTRLIEKGETPETAEQCVNWLCDMGLINDTDYAASVVRHYAAKGYGITRIKQELNRHGIGREFWVEALEEMPEQDEKLERFLRSRLTDPNDKAQVKKVSDALFRRGYTWDQIKHALYNYRSQEDY